MQGPCEKVKQVKLWTILAWYLYFFAQNWKCGTSTKGTKVPPGHLPLPLSTTRLSERRAKTLTPMGSLQLEWRKGWSVLAHLACRTLLSVSLSPIPVTGSPALSGLALFLLCDNWHCLD